MIDIHSHILPGVDDGVSANSLTAIEPPLWAGLMATFLRKKGFFVKVIFMDGEKKSHENSIWDGHHS